MELLCEPLRRRWQCINMSAHKMNQDADTWEINGSRPLTGTRWGTLRCRGGEQRGGGLDRCSASFALLRLKFRGCNCCQCRWVTGERRRWWCHGDCLACRAAAASFPNRSTFLRIVVKEMSSEQKPIWQLRVKWGEKSKSHSIWERLGGGAYPATLGLSLHLFPRGSMQDGTLVPALWNKMLLLSAKEHT